MRAENSTQRIVLVEDEETLANLIETGLRKEGYDVQTAYDGVAGLKLIREVKPDLVLLDIMLPGIKGFDILKKLHEEDHIIPDTPVIIISNTGDAIEIERAQNMGVRDFLIKVNFNPDEVIEKVNNLFESESVKAKKNAMKDQESKSYNRHILIIEDDTILSDALERKFVEKEYIVSKAYNANLARAILAKEKIDFILLDLVLPDEHGLTFLEQLKLDKNLGAIPVMITSNLGQQEEVDKGLQAGAVDYVIKTNTVPGEIYEKVEKFLNQGQKV